MNDGNESNNNFRDQNSQSIYNQVDIKDYFTTKISMRRSIDKKLHYEHARNQAPNPQLQAIKKY